MKKGAGTLWKDKDLRWPHIGFCENNCVLSPINLIIWKRKIDESNWGHPSFTFQLPHVIVIPELPILNILCTSSLEYWQKIFHSIFYIQKCSKVQCNFSCEKTYACFTQNYAMNFGFLRIYVHLCNALQYILIVS